MSNNQNISHEQHERLSVSFIVHLRDKIEERVANGEADRDQVCGKYAKIIDELLWCFFDSGREDCGLRHPSSMMKISEMLEFIEDSLQMMSQYRSDLLNLDWQGKWQLAETVDEY